MTEPTNVCEHGDHAAPTGARFCSSACRKCEVESTNGCDGYCNNRMKPVLVGECNPYGADPYFALYHLPRAASGNRLRIIIGLSDDEYLETFDRVNLCDGRWTLAAGRQAAAALAGGDRPLVLLGAKVCSAFGVSFEPLVAGDLGDADGLLLAPRPRVPYLVVPHPSGLNRWWDDERRAQAREAVKEWLAGLPAST